eukprot:6483703-Amphidinium_carterae.1
MMRLCHIAEKPAPLTVPTDCGHDKWSQGTEILPRLSLVASCHFILHGYFEHEAAFQELQRTRLVEWQESKSCEQKM